jgi:hypothetical protein
MHGTKNKGHQNKCTKNQDNEKGKNEGNYNQGTRKPPIRPIKLPKNWRELSGVSINVRHINMFRSIVIF